MVLVKLTKEDLKIILRDMGSILFVVGYILLLPLAVAYIYGENELYFAFLYPGVVSMLIGLLLKKIFREAGETKLRHAMINAGFAWLVISLIGAVPYRYYGMDFLNAYFESISGFTTTGLSTLDIEVEVMPKGILFWRALSQWVGGVGVIMLFLVVLIQPAGVIGRFYAAEGRTDRIAPAISKTVSYIWKIYISFTIIGIVLYYIAGMNIFDAVTHTFSALSTGGFSTKNLNIEAYNSVGIEAVSILLMLVGGTSFVILYGILTGEKEIISRNPEIKAYIGFIIFGAILISGNLIFIGTGVAKALRLAIFQATSALTTTGFNSTGLASWPEFSKAILVLLMIAGSMSGSTGGGLKIIRSLILVKLSYYEVVRALIPERAVLVFKIKEKTLENEEILRVASFFFVYTTLLFASGLLITMLGYNFLDSIFLVASAQGNVGLSSFSQPIVYLSPVAKIILIANTWIGRLEIFPALALLGSIAIAVRREEKST